MTAKYTFEIPIVISTRWRAWNSSLYSTEYFFRQMVWLRESIMYCIHICNKKKLTLTESFKLTFTDFIDTKIAIYNILYTQDANIPARITMLMHNYISPGPDGNFFIYIH